MKFPNLIKTSPFAPRSLRQIGGILLTVLALVSAAQAQEPKPGVAQWPGVTAEIFSIMRLDGNRVAARFFFTSAPSAPSALIADKFFVPDGSPATAEAFDAAGPYTVAGATLIDEASAKSFPSSARRAGEARPGRPEIKLELTAGNGFLIGQIFECPAVNQEDPPKKQFVSFQLPGFKQPITGVPLPREVNQPIQFGRKKDDEPSALKR